MRREFFSLFHFFAVFPILYALALPLHAQDQPVTISSNKWVPVSLPFRPTEITATATTFWVCGADEMIARSSDGGHTWKVVHKNPDGEVLLAINFSNEKNGFAAGTNGRFLSTNDAGESWKSWDSDSESTLDLSFADDQHGLRKTLSAAEITSDGGQHWAAIPFPPAGSTFRPPFHVLGIAALSASNLAVEFAQSYGEHIYFSTTDAGRSWKSTRLNDTYAGSLYVHGDEYWSYGVEYVDRQNRGGYGVGVALHSIDGENWSRGARPPHEFSSCAAQGCILDTGGYVDLSGPQPRFATLPADSEPAPRWSLADGFICAVGVTLECASAIPSETPGPLVRPNRPIAQAVALGLTDSVANCLFCTLTSFPLAKNRLRQVPVAASNGPGAARTMYMPGLNAELELEFVVRKDGSVDRVRVKDAPKKEIEAAVLSDVQNWLFVPPRENGTHVERKMIVKLDVHCMAFPDNDEATCAPRFPIAPQQ
jgi:photosynthesis system II assembly factor YCF48-like protein/TonB-like protein